MGQERLEALAASYSLVGDPAQGVGFAIPADRVKLVTDQLIQRGRLVRTSQGFLAVARADVTPQWAAADHPTIDRGVRIARFTQDATGATPAQAAGLREGEIIVVVNGTAIADKCDLAGALLALEPTCEPGMVTPAGRECDLAGALLALEPGTRVDLTIQRGGTRQRVTAPLGERLANLGG